VRDGLGLAVRGRRPARHAGRQYPRMARVNEVLREVLAEAIELAAGTDARLELMTVTAVDCDPDMRHATVLLASLPEAAKEALAEARPRLQAAVAHQVRIKRTPQLTFEADPSVAYGERVESILRDLRSSGQLSVDEDGRGSAQDAPGAGKAGEQEPPAPAEPS